MENRDCETVVHNLKAEIVRLTMANNALCTQLDIYRRTLISAVVILAIVLGYVNFTFINSLREDIYIIPLTFAEMAAIVVWFIALEDKAAYALSYLCKEFAGIFFIIVILSYFIFGAAISAVRQYF